MIIPVRYCKMEVINLSVFVAAINPTMPEGVFTDANDGMDHC